MLHHLVLHQVWRLQHQLVQRHVWRLQHHLGQHQVWRLQHHIVQHEVSQHRGAIHRNPVMCDTSLENTHYTRTPCKENQCKTSWWTESRLQQKDLPGDSIQHGHFYLNMLFFFLSLFLFPLFFPFSFLSILIDEIYNVVTVHDNANCHWFHTAPLPCSLEAKGRLI